MKSEKEKSNVTITENNALEDNTQEKIQEKRMRTIMDNVFSQLIEYERYI